jgi:hypothetical protein
MARPVTKYRPATFQPKRPASSTRATSFTIGAATRNESVTPSGMPTCTKPMKSGTAEHEQKGVTTPSSAARTLPADSRFPARIARVRSGVKNDRTMPTTKTTPTRRSRTFGTSYRKKATLSPRWVPAPSPSSRKVAISEMGFTLQ